jgi:tetratricopeptide (TPR) repeat protein
MLLGLANAVLAFILAKRWFGHSVGIITAALMVTYWTFMYFEGVLLAPVVVIFLVLCLMLALDCWLKKITITNSIIAGIFFSLASLARPNILLFAPAVVVWAVWLKFKNKEQRLIVALLGFILSSVLTLAPATLRNYLVSKDFVLITSTSGINLHIGNNELTNGVWPTIPYLYELIGKTGWTSFDCQNIHRAIERQVGREMKPSEVSKYFTQKAIDFIKNNPRQTASMTCKKALIFWGPSEVSNNSVIEMDRKNSSLLKYLPGFPLAFSMFLFGSGILCMNIRKQRKAVKDVVFANRQTGALILIFLFIVIYFFSYLPFFIAARFRVPIVPFLLIPAAYGINCIIQLIIKRNIRSLVISIAVAIALYFFASYEFIEYKPDVALWYQQNADVLLRTGQTQRAIEEYLNSLELQPDSHRSLERLGRAYFLNKDYKNAVVYWEKAVEIQPNDKETHARMGDCFQFLGDYDNAVKHWSIAASLDPGEPLFFYNIGLVYHKKGMLDEAIEYYQKVLSINPEHKKANNNLSIALQEKEAQNQ